MDRIIEIKVNGNYVSKDNQNAGVQGEGNITALRIEFDEGWDGCAKTITWWDAKGENPTSRVLTADLLEDIVASTRVYLTLIPPEPLAIWGKCMFGIDGYVNGKRQKSAYANLVVKPNGTGVDAIIEKPTATQIEQLQVQIDVMLDEMQAQAIIATNAAEKAQISAIEADRHAKTAQLSELNAKDSADSAAHSVHVVQMIEQRVKESEVKASASEHAAAASATNSAEGAQLSVSSAKAAEKSAINAEKSVALSAQNALLADRAKNEAEASKSNAEAYADSAEYSAGIARNFADKVVDLQYKVEQDALRVDTNTGIVLDSASDAEAWSIGTRNGIAVGSSDPAYMNNAKYYKEQAKQIAGGNFATEEYVDEKVQGIVGDIDCGTF